MNSRQKVVSVAPCSWYREVLNVHMCCLTMQRSVDGAEASGNVPG